MKVQIKKFVFNPFQVNTYVIYDEAKQALIVDPACYEDYERSELAAFIEIESLTPVLSINTHCHIDHILGNSFIDRKYNLKPTIHKSGESFLHTAKDYGLSFGLHVDAVPMPERHIDDMESISIGNTNFEVRYVPGHADGSVCLVFHDIKTVITGDVIFNGSIGRTDLPTGNFDLLIEGITNKLLTLPDDYKLLCGHGQETTIGYERKYNPFLCK